MTFTNLQRRIVYGDLDLTSYPFMVLFDGEEWSSGDLVTTILSSFLQDGELELSDSRGNMSLAIPIGIEGDLAEIAEAEALLALEAAKPTNMLLVDPGDDLAPPTVFDTFRGTPDFNFATVGEQNGLRRFALRVNALPHGRSDFTLTTTAVPASGSPTTVSINDGSSTTGWTSTSGSVSTSGGSVRGAGGGGANLTLTQSVNVAGTRWIMADWSAPEEFDPGANAQGLVVGTAVGSSAILFPYRSDQLTSGLKRSYWQIPTGIADAVTSLTFSIRFYKPGQLSIDQVSRTSAPPSLGTNRQQALVVDVAGSARTQGGVQIASPTSSLGEVLVYTSSGGLLPAVGSLRSSAPPTTDASRVSGGYYTLNTATVFDIPMASLTPGLYALVALTSSPAGGARTLTWTAKARVNSVDVGRVYDGTAGVSGASYTFVTLGSVDLPTTGVRASTTGIQRVQVQDLGSGSSARLDELYVCNMTTGRLTIVSCGTGTASAGGPSSRLWLDPATITSRTPSILRGFAADGSDAFYAGDSIQAAGQHDFEPTSVNVFIVTTNATDAAADLTHSPRWLGHAALAAP